MQVFVWIASPAIINLNKKQEPPSLQVRFLLPYCHRHFISIQFYVSLYLIFLYTTPFACNDKSASNKNQPQDKEEPCIDGTIPCLWRFIQRMPIGRASGAAVGRIRRSAACGTCTAA